MNSETIESRLTDIFSFHVNKRVSELKSKGTRFVHYTSAEAALSILQNQEFWLRQPGCMNDKLEIEHGLNCLRECFNKDVSFKMLLDSIKFNLSEEVIQSFNHLLELIRRDTYLISISEHDESEDQYGRLSMWRAYGGECGVAIVMNQSSFFSESDALKSYTYPVFYHGDTDFKEMFLELSKRMSISREFLVAQNQDDLLLTNILSTFLSWVIAIKHPGFSEEKEWRVVHSPTLDPSDYLKKEIKSIKGVPQEIYTVKLISNPSEGVTGISPNELIDRIIIGPTDYPLVIQKAFVRKLEDLGVNQAADKVWVSSIPLRR